METNVNVLTYAAAIRRGCGVLEAQYATPIFAEGLVPVHVEVTPYGPLTEAGQAELHERLAEAFKSRPAREARLKGK